MSVAQAFWDEVYRGRDPVRPGRPHPFLVKELGDVSPGKALELGCGEGTNAIWLAAQGWTVTAVDVSQVALNHAAAFAERAGVDARVRWQCADLRDWTTKTFDLVAAFYMHTPLELDYPSTLRRAANQLRAEGTLLIVGHYTLPPWAWDPDATDRLLSADELASAPYNGQGHIVLDAGLHAARAAVPVGD